MYSLFSEVIQPSRLSRKNDELEQLHRQLSRSGRKISTESMGAPSQNGTGPLRTVGKLVRSGSTSVKNRRLLEKLIEKFGCKTIYELGTSLGMTTLYLSRPDGTRVWTFEGNQQLAEFAETLFRKNTRTNIELITGNIDQTLPAALNTCPAPDLVYLDANHRYAPTLEYVNKCLAVTGPDLICVVGDIYWSAEMTRAWKDLRDHPDTTVSVDLFELGILFFRHDLSRGNYVL